MTLIQPIQDSLDTTTFLTSSPEHHLERSGQRQPISRGLDLSSPNRIGASLKRNGHAATQSYNWP